MNTPSSRVISTPTISQFRRGGEQVERIVGADESCINRMRLPQLAKASQPVLIAADEVKHIDIRTQQALERERLRRGRFRCLRAAGLGTRVRVLHV